MICIVVRDLVYALLGVAIAMASANAQSQTAQPPNATADHELADPDRDAQDWKQKFADLAQQYRSANRPQRADLVERWLPLPYPDRQQLWLLSTEPVEQPAWDAGDPLDQAFLELRRQRAEASWKASRVAADAGDIERAYRLMLETLWNDPQHAPALRALSLLQANSTVKCSPGRGREKRLGWAASAYWRATTAHFAVISNTSPEQTEEIARLCEDFHGVWRQLFTSCWTDRRSVIQAFDGRPLRWGGRRRHFVVVFQTRQQFLNYLQPLESKIEIATGVYRDKDRITYLYAGEPSLRATWLHELTHQLFQESAATGLDTGAAANFWAVEAVAMYCESAKFRSDHCLVGGWDAERLQTARYRRRNEGYYLPLKDLNRLTKQDLQQHADIRRLYTQSAGLAHFLIDGRNGAYRRPFLELVRDLYRRPGKSESLSQALQVEWHRLDDQYNEFLDVQDEDLQRLPDADQVKQLSLGFTQVTDAGLMRLSEAAQLEWLDLAGLPITDRGLRALHGCAALKRLSLMGTKVTDAGLQQLDGCRLLEELDLSQTEVTDLGLDQLAERHPRLSAVWLSGTRVTADGVRKLADLKELRELDLEGTSVTALQWQQLRDLFPGLVGVDPTTSGP